MLKRPNVTTVSKRIMICPLNWGIGHATRCIPIIQHLAELGHEVIIAADGASFDLLRQEFPTLEHIRFPGIHIRYSASDSQLMSIVLQTPSLLSSLKHENRFIIQKARDLRIDAIISDNRYGAYHKNLPSVLISHQLNLALPEKVKWAEPLIQNMIHRLINRFDQCWVPDFETNPRLSGRLSNQNGIKIPIRYIGMLSRFLSSVNDAHLQATKDHFVLAVVSGPEPQRSLFEQSIIKHFTESGCPLKLLRGLPDVTTIINCAPNIQIYNYLKGWEMHDLFLNADHIICRSGYSTLMDLMATGREAFLVPTPGQPEQEYLANHLKNLNWFASCNQSEFGGKYPYSHKEYKPPLIASHFPLREFLRQWSDE